MSQVVVSGTDVKVRTKKVNLEVTKRVKAMSNRADDDKRVFLIVGGGKPVEHLNRINTH